MFFLVPLYLAIQAMGKFADVKYVADAGARYAAWERTVWFNETTSSFHQKNQPNQKSDAAIRNEIAVRLLNDRSRPLKYKATDAGAGSYANGLDPMWEDTAGKPYLRNYAQVVGGSSYARPSRDILGSAISTVNAVSIPHVTGQLAPPVPSNTLASTEFRLTDVGADSEVYKRLWGKAKGLPNDWAGVTVNAQAGVLSNTWAANASSGTLNMVKESVPTANGLGTAVQTGVWALVGPWDPMVAPRLSMGKIGVDVVPPDRLR